jgi:RNA polymerase sigma-70 factor (ECF subfamily)
VAPNDPNIEHEIAGAVQAVRAGNPQAYAAIVQQFQHPIMTLCVAILRNRQAAEELAQDVFVRAFERLDTFDVRRPMKPWLARIAYRLAQERGRARRRDRARREAAAGLLHQNGCTSRPIDSLLVDEQSTMLWQAVHGLPMAERTAIVLYYREGLTVSEAASAMGVSPGTVKTHLFRARAKIQADLRAKGFDEGGVP